MVKSSAIVIAMLPLLVGMRDPFQVPPDRCHIAMLTQWRYQGSISGASRLLGFLRDPQGRWRRAAQGQILDNGWRVTVLTPERLEIETGPGCEPARWQWWLHGEKNDAMDKPAVPDTGAAGVGRKKRLAGGG